MRVASVSGYNATVDLMQCVIVRSHTPPVCFALQKAAFRICAVMRLKSLKCYLQLGCCSLPKFETATHMLPSVQCVWRPPSELRNPPDSLVKTVVKSRTKHWYTRSNGATSTRVCASVPPEPSQLPSSNTKAHGRVVKRKSSVLADHPPRSSIDLDIQSFVLSDKRWAVVPFCPSYYCKELVDESRELLVVELQSATGSHRQAWLEDEKLSAVLVCTLAGVFIVSRQDLRTYVKRTVPFAKPIRNLNKALYKICTPLGVEGPTVTLLPAQEVLREMDHSPCEELEEKAGALLGGVFS